MTNAGPDVNCAENEKARFTGSDFEWKTEIWKAAIVTLVERILAAKRAEGGTGIPAFASTESQTRMSVAQWEREIDERVYRLYGLTPAEIKIVEERTQR